MLEKGLPEAAIPLLTRVDLARAPRIPLHPSLLNALDFLSLSTSERDPVPLLIRTVLESTPIGHRRGKWISKPCRLMDR